MFNCKQRRFWPGEYGTPRARFCSTLTWPKNQGEDTSSEKHNTDHGRQFLATLGLHADFRVKLISRVSSSQRHFCDPTLRLLGFPFYHTHNRVGR